MLDVEAGETTSVFFGITFETEGEHGGLVDSDGGGIGKFAVSEWRVGVGDDEVGALDERCEVVVMVGVVEAEDEASGGVAIEVGGDFGGGFSVKIGGGVDIEVTKRSGWGGKVGGTGLRIGKINGALIVGKNVAIRGSKGGMIGVGIA